MASYRFVSDARFKPFSYSELLAPLLMQTQAHQQLQEEYSQLSTQASVWEKLANSAVDKKEYEQYRKYADDLQSKVDELSRNGLDTYSRNNMLNMRDRYIREINPIKEAWDERDRQIRAQQEMMIKDPTHRFRYDASSMGLSNFMGDRKMDTLKDNYSGAILTKQVSDAVSHIKQGLQKRGALTSIGLPFQYEREIQNGATIEDVMGIMQAKGDTSSLNTIQRVLQSAVNQVIGSSGVSSWEDQRLKDAAMEFALMGTFSAIGPTSYEKYHDSYSSDIAAYQAKKRMDAAEKAAKEKEAKSYIPDYRAGVFDGDAQNFANLLEAFTFESNGKRRVKGGWGNKNDKRHALVNPLKVYEEYDKILKSKGRSLGNPSIEGAMKRDAMNTIREKYGVDNVLDDTQYEKLKDLGYTSKSDIRDFSADKLADKINKRSVRYRANRINMVDYDNISESVISSIQASKGQIWEYDNKNGKKSSSIDIEDVLGKNGKGKIVDIAVSLNNNNNNPEVIATINNGEGGSKDVIIPLYHFGTNASDAYKGIVDKWYKEADNSLAEIRSKGGDATIEELKLAWMPYMQDKLAEILYKNFNAFNQKRPSTDSNL